MFLLQTLTNANFQDDIFPNSICPGDIYPYQQYHSYYCPTFDQNFRTQIFLGGLIFVHHLFLDLNFFPSFFRQTFFELIFWTKIFYLDLFGPKFFYKIFIDLKFFLDQNYSYLLVLGPKIFGGPNFFFTQIFFWTHNYSFQAEHF